MLTGDGIFRAAGRLLRFKEADVVRKERCHSFMRMIAALILAVAAGLKLSQIMQEGLARFNGMSLFWLLLVIYELTLSAWTVTGMLGRLCSRVLVYTFAAFSLASLGTYFRGSETCGCFGDVRTSPIFVFAIDIFIGIGLWVTCDREIYRCCSHWRSRILLIAKSGSVFAAFTLSIVVVSLPKSNGLVLERIDDTILLYPLQFVGKKYPLRDYTDFPGDLTRGKWVVFIHRSGCYTCQQAKPFYQSLERSEKSINFAFLEIKTGSGSNVSSGAKNIGALSGRVEWAIETPLVLLIDDGVVTDVAVGVDVANRQVNTSVMKFDLARKTQTS